MIDLRDFLARRAQELEAQIAEHRLLIIPLERELYEIRLAKAAVHRRSREPQQPQLFDSKTIAPECHAEQVAWKNHIEAEFEKERSPYARLTIKQLIVSALKEHFPSGATAAQLLALFDSVWGRNDVVRTSLSPQLSRLKQENRIGRNGSSWFLKNALGDLAESKTAVDT